MRTVLETQSLSKIYQSGNLSIRAVDKVSLCLNAGEFIALVGPSGSGKTTMLAMLAALLTPSEGKIMIDNTELGAMSEKQRTGFRREKIGFTFQTNNLLPYLTAHENVELMLRLNNKIKLNGGHQAIELLTRLGLGDRLNSFPSQLSGGQQQRVAIARALVHQPSVVLADEPTASLDTERAYQVVEILADLIHEGGRTGIMVTHDLRMTQFVDRVIQMMDGKIVREIYDRQEIDALAAMGRQETAPPEARLNPIIRAVPILAPSQLTPLPAGD